MSIPLTKRITSFIKLGESINTVLMSKEETNLSHAEVELFKSINNAQFENPWFTPENCRYALKGISNMLEEEKLNSWLKNFKIAEINSSPKTIAVVMAGNIPAVGFHDLLCVLISGNNMLAKLSSNDTILIKALKNMLVEIDNGWGDKIIFEEHILKSFDAIIATGSNNTARYFEYYFGKYPNIIRKNRTSIAILNGNESDDDLRELSEDIFRFYGLGCRNVSQILIPEKYVIEKIFPLWGKWAEISNHHKYANNYDYNKSIFLINKIKHFDLGYALFRKNSERASPVSVVNYQYYKEADFITEYINSNRDNIQCVVSNNNIPGITSPIVKIGQAQTPELWDYADGVNTLEWILKL